MGAVHAGDAEGHTALVLIVDVERAIATIVADVVAAAGYTPLVATNGREALDLARSRWPALVVTDLMMPHLDGSGLARALCAEAESRGLSMPPVIVMTAASISYAHESSADAILRKPFTLNELETLLHRFLG